MEKNYEIYPDVVFGVSPQIGSYVIIGVPASHSKDSAKGTIIGNRAKIRSHTVIYSHNIIGDDFQTGHQVMIRESNQIGNSVSVGTGTVIEHHVVIGNNVRIHSKAFIPEFTTIEDGAWIGPNVVITNAKYPLSKGVKENLQGARIKKGAKVGANATLLPGVTIGENSLVGAGSVVTKDVPPGSVVVGNPAKLINSVKNLPYEGTQ